MFASTEGHSCFGEGKTTAPVRADVGRVGLTGFFIPLLLLPGLVVFGLLGLFGVVGVGTQV